MIKKCILLLLFIANMGSIHAQDEHFSQFYALPMHLNPSLTGAYQGTYRIGAIYRNQWNNALASGYRTIAAGGDTSIDFRLDKKNQPNKIGVGILFTNDEFNALQFSNSKLAAFASFQKRLSDKNPSYLGAGIQLGVVQHNVNYDNLTFQDQFNQIDNFDGLTNELLPPNNFGTFDVSVGINYSLQLPNTSIYLGVASHHINEPSFSFFNNLQLPNPTTDISQNLNSRLVGHFSIDQKINYNLFFQPRAVYQQQGPHNQLDIGTNFEYILKSRTSAIIFGLWLTGVNDLDNLHLESITPLLGLRQDNFIFGFTYEIHTQDVGDPNFGFNTFEFSIRFSGEATTDRAFCPTF